ncbi:hypothetical protein F383_37444 [Gossypium arboreum]|uniref:Uncharacterized protein n=1 Tax=Gossypium arboreum TaxID=29729 RepID=A0A0B0MFB8_GOSAR|nr:hypothetical protein F383_37444 [Gossypium arboreum]
MHRMVHFAILSL